MINVVIPMAGEGSRFRIKGYEKPKPFIDIFGKPMIYHVLNNLKIEGARYILIGRNEHLENEKAAIEILKREFEIICVGLDFLTEGTLCTTLFAREFFNSDDCLIIANSDQIVNINIQDSLDIMNNIDLDGLIICFKEESRSTKWSYVKVDNKNFVTEVKEKDAISDLATVGIYLFKNGREFINYSIELIINNDRVNNEFYTCPVYNYFIQENKKIGVHEIKKSEMIGLGTPEDLEIYLKLNES